MPGGDLEGRRCATTKRYGERNQWHETGLPYQPDLLDEQSIERRTLEPIQSARLHIAVEFVQQEKIRICPYERMKHRETREYPCELWKGCLKVGLANALFGKRNEVKTSPESNTTSRECLFESEDNGVRNRCSVHPSSHGDEARSGTLRPLETPARQSPSSACGSRPNECRLQRQSAHHR